MFGTPGSRHDLKIMDQSRLFNDKRIEELTHRRSSPSAILLFSEWNLSEVFKNFHVCILTRKQEKEKFMLPLVNQVEKKLNVYSVFCVVRPEIVYQTCSLTKIIDMNYVVQACVTMHNMFDKHIGYDGTMIFRKKL